MNIVIVTVGLMFLFGSVNAVHERENSNVLVPNNDVNFQAKIKKLLSDDEVDPEDFSDNEIESLKTVKNKKIEKLLTRTLEKENKVNDEKNKNKQENEIDHEVRVGLVDADKDLNDEKNSLRPPKRAGDQLTSTTVPSVWTTRTFPIETTQTIPMVTTRSNENFARTSSWIMPTTPNDTSVGSTTNGTFPITLFPTSSEAWTTTNIISSTFPITPNTSTTVIVPSTPNSTTSGSNNVTTPIESTSVTSTTLGSFPDPTFLTTPYPSTTPFPVSEDPLADECVQGKPARNLVWVDSQGRINEGSIGNRNNGIWVADFTRDFNNSFACRNFVLSGQSFENFKVTCF